MKNRILKFLSLIMTFLCVFSVVNTPSYALEWSGDANGVGGNATGVSDYGFAIADEDDNLAGYRFSVVDIDGDTRNGKVIDIFRQTDMGRSAYYCTYSATGHKMNPKRNKVQWIKYQNNGYSTGQSTSNQYLENKTVHFASSLPATTSIENWVKSTINLNEILDRLNIESYHDLNPGDKLLVEPLYHIRINSKWHTLTISEIGVFGKSKYGASSNGGTNYTSGYWGFIKTFTNRIFPNALYEPTGSGDLWTPAYQISAGSYANFQTLINYGYGVGVAYDTSKERGYTVEYLPNGADSGSTPKSLHVAGVEKELSPNGFKKELHIFKGWNTKPDGSGTSFTDKQKVKDLTDEKNVVIKLYAQWEVDPVIQIEAIQPNSKYREGVTVISSFRVINESEEDEFTPDKNVTVKFSVKKGGSQIYSTTKTGVVIPKDEKNLVYFKWTVPSGLNNASLNVSAEVLVGDLHMDKASMSVSTGIPANYQAPDTQYERTAPDDWQSSDGVPKPEKYGSASWSEWAYEGGSFVKKNYRISMTSSDPVISADSGSPSTGSSTLKSGYGISLDWKPEARSTGSVTATSGMYTQIQTAYATFPEFEYVTTGNCCLLEKVGGSFCFYVNEEAEGDRIHFTPLWYPNGSNNYTVRVCGYDCWTPAGMIKTDPSDVYSVEENSNSFSINGSLYDDYFIGRK